MRDQESNDEISSSQILVISEIVILDENLFPIPVDSNPAPPVDSNRSPGRFKSRFPDRFKSHSHTGTVDSSPLRFPRRFELCYNYFDPIFFGYFDSFRVPMEKFELNTFLRKHNI